MRVGSRCRDSVGTRVVDVLGGGYALAARAGGRSAIKTAEEIFTVVIGASPKGSPPA
jgi:hypothetical protein